MVDIGALRTCEPIQLQEKAAHAKSSSCLGPDVSNWQPSNIKTVGVIIGLFYATICCIAATHELGPHSFEPPENFGVMTDGAAHLLQPTCLNDTSLL